jgi:hypothetical protein
VRRLLVRTSLFSESCCGRPLEVDFRALHLAARSVRIARDHTRLFTFSRFSFAQGERVPVGGRVGSVLYAGDLAPFLPLLVLGEVLHVGKDTVLGQGQYRIDDAVRSIGEAELERLYPREDSASGGRHRESSRNPRNPVTRGR